LSIGPLTFLTAFSAKTVFASEPETETPEGTEATPTDPSSSPTVVSTVQLPAESKIFRAEIFLIFTAA